MKTNLKHLRENIKFNEIYDLIDSVKTNIIVTIAQVMVW